MKNLPFTNAVVHIDSDYIDVFKVYTSGGDPLNYSNQQNTERKREFIEEAIKEKLEREKEG